MTFSQQGKEGARVKARYGHPQMSAFHLACVWKSGFLPLTLNDLILSEGVEEGKKKCLHRISSPNINQ